MRVLPVLLCFWLLTLLAACGRSGPTTLEEMVLEVDVVSLPASPAPVAASVVLLDPLALPVAPASVVPITPFVYRGEASEVTFDGKASVRFPRGSELPPQLLAPSDRFVYDEFTGEACDTVTSVPDARVTFLSTGEIPLPTVLAFGVAGAEMSLVTAEPLDLSLQPPALFEEPFLSWVYATQAVDVRTAEGGCLPPGGDYVIDVDLSLAAGWNQVAMRYGWDPVAEALAAVTIRGGDAATYYLNSFGIP